MNRILHIPNYYIPHIGGIEDVCFNIVRILKQNEATEQFVFCYNDKPVTEKDVVEGVVVQRVGIKKIIASQPISFCYRKELKYVIETFKPTHVHFHAPNPLGAFLLLGLIPKDVKLIIHWHSDIVAQKLIYAFIKPIERMLLKRADIILATSPAYIDQSKPLKRFNNKVDVLQNIIDPQKFIFTEQCAKRVERIKAQYNNLPIVLFVGRHVQYKGIEFLIQAAKIVDQCCAIVIGGQGPLTEKLKQEAAANDNIYFIGRVEEDELVAYFYAANIFAFPSITKNEAFGVALAEAMYCKTPAITFTIKGSGVNWVSLHNQTGIEVENSNSTAFGDAINRLLSDKDLMERYATSAQQRIEQYMIAPVIKEKLNQIYR